MENIIRVGMADLAITSQPAILTTLGLGSCVGIALYEPMSRVAGLAHIMLPWSTQATDASNSAKFADTAIAKMLNEMKSAGAWQGNIKAKLAGGAQMFSFSQSSDIMKIGLRNAQAAKEVLVKAGIPVIAEDTGGTCGRTIELYSDSGILVIKTIGFGVKRI